MAWRKVTLDEQNLCCDISDEDIYLAADEVKKQLGEAGVILGKKSQLHHNGKVIRKKPSPKKAASAKSSVRNHNLTMQQKREKV